MAPPKLLGGDGAHVTDDDVLSHRQRSTHLQGSVLREIEIGGQREIAVYGDGAVHPASRLRGLIGQKGIGIHSHRQLFGNEILVVELQRRGGFGLDLSERVDHQTAIFHQRFAVYRFQCAILAKETQILQLMPVAEGDGATV